MKLTANDRIVLHHVKVFTREDIPASGRRDENLSLRRRLLHRRDLIARDRRLQRIDRIHLRHDDSCTHTVQSLRTPFTHITIPSHNCDFACNHDISRALDTINQRLPAAVQVIELGLGDRIVDVDGGDQEARLFQHAVQVVHARRRLLRDAVAALEHFRVLVVHERGEVAAVVEDQVEGLAVLEGGQLLLKAPVVFFFRLAFPGEDGGAGGGDGGGRVILCAELGTVRLSRGRGVFGLRRVFVNVRCCNLTR